MKHEWPSEDFFLAISDTVHKLWQPATGTPSRTQGGGGGGDWSLPWSTPNMYASPAEPQLLFPWR